MKFNEEQIMRLIQQEQSTWDNEDLSWFDEKYFAAFETKKLPVEEREKIIAMLANDQTVMNHYLQMKRKVNHSSQQSAGMWRIFSFKRSVMVMASLTGFVASLWLVYNNVEVVDNTEIYRSPTEILIYPQDNKVLQNAPTYLVAPKVDAGFKIELLRASQLIWQTPELSTPRVYLPPEVRSQLTVGLYNWKIMTTDDQLLHSYYFSIE
jgi:hypothetical protein